jgi:hypothetical protein
MNGTSSFRSLDLIIKTFSITVSLLHQSECTCPVYSAQTVLGGGVGVVENDRWLVQTLPPFGNSNSCGFLLLRFHVTVYRGRLDDDPPTDGHSNREAIYMDLAPGTA